MNVRLNHVMHFTAGVYYGGEMRMNNYSLRVWMNTNTYDAESHNVAFERIKYFVYNQIDSSIFVNSEHKEICQKYADAGIRVTTLPGEPVDQIIGIMLYYKLNAITENRMIILETEISSAMGDNMVYLHGDNENTNIKDRPEWWESADLTHCDWNLLDSDKVVTMHQSSVWRDLDLAWSDMPAEDNSGNVVVFADFKRPNETE